MLTEIPIKTLNPVVDAQGNPFVGARVVFKLDRTDLDVIDNSPIIATAEASVALDGAGLLPVGAMALWPNSRGRTGSRWSIGVKQGTSWILGPVLVHVTPPVSPAVDLDLFTLLADPTAVAPAYLSPGV